MHINPKESHLSKIAFAKLPRLSHPFNKEIKYLKKEKEKPELWVLCQWGF